MIIALLIAIALLYVAFGAGVTDELDAFSELSRKRKVALVAFWPLAIAFISGMVITRMALERLFCKEETPDDPDEPDETEPPEPMPWELGTTKREKRKDRPN